MINPLAPAVELVRLGVIPHEDYADARNPGPRWLADIADMLAQERQEAALKALGKLDKEDVAAILEALGD